MSRRVFEFLNVSEVDGRSVFVRQRMIIVGSDDENDDFEEELRRSVIQDMLNSIQSILTSTRASREKIVIDKVAKETTGTDDVCSICLEPLSTNTVVKLNNCGHEYHKDCLEKALEVKDKCCLCRTCVRSSEKNN